MSATLKTLMQRTLELVLTLFVSVVICPTASIAQSRTIKYIVPLAPGGPNDTVARMVAEQIGRDGGPTLVIENRPGAGTVIGTEQVARSLPDGNTLLMAAGSFVVNPHLKKMNYDPLTSFEPICYLAESPQMIVVPSSSPFKTLGDLITAAQQRPGALTIAANGPATTQHVQIEALKFATRANITFVPFPGDGPAMNSVLGDQVSAAALDYATASAQLKAGTLRGLVIGSNARIPELPDVPTFSESGIKDTEWAGTFGVMAPAKTPQPILEELIGWFSKALQSPDLRKKFANLSVFPKGQCGSDYGAIVRKQYETFGRSIRATNFKID